jgi:hypothetical protein
MRKRPRQQGRAISLLPRPRWPAPDGGKRGGAGEAVALREAVTAETAVSPREAVTTATNVDGPLTTSTYADGEFAANKVYPPAPAANASARP